MPLKIPDPAAFGISPTRGFLSPDAPPEAFSNSYYAAWDALIGSLPELIATRTLASEIQALPLLSAAKLPSELEYRRAYVVLAFLVHGYVWAGSGDGRPVEGVPPQLAEPFLHVCERVGMRPVLSYAGLCLWNWRLKGQDCGGDGAMELDRLESLASFTGSRGEDAFYHVPDLIEAEGGSLVSLLLDAISAGEREDMDAVVSALNRSADAFIRMAQHLPKLYSTLDAQVFYHQIRPFFAGGKGMEDKGLPRGVVFKKSDGSEHCVKCAGGSAVQSALFHFLDHALGVEHKPSDVGAPESIFEEMRVYMPGAHREFLELVSELPSLRSFVQRHSSNGELCEAYDNCLKQLRLWRSKHIAIVSKYIVQPARLAEKGDQNGKVERLEVNGSETASDWELQGTGGSALIPFLKQARDETVGVSEHRGKNGI